MGEFTFESLEVVVLGHPAGEQDVGRRTDVARPGHPLPVRADHDQRLIDAPVIAIVVDQDLGPPRHRPSQPDRPSICVGGGQREAPVGEAESPRQLRADPGSVFRGHHRGGAAELGESSLNRFDRRGRGVPGHGAGIAQTEVDQVVPIDILDMGSPGFGEIEGKATGAFVHPGHRDPPKKVPGGGVRGVRTRVA